MHTWLLESLKEYMIFKDYEWEFFIKHGKTIKLKPKDLFFRSGIIANKMGFVKKGILRAFTENKKGEIITSYFYWQPRNYIVTLHTSFTLDIPSEHFVEAISDCEILCFEKKDIFECLEKIPKMETLARKIAEKHYIGDSKRIHNFQSKNAKELYSDFLNECGDLILKVPQHMIASYLGMSQYTLSKIKK
jgi:CRP-like cAMP-binding protein